MISKFPDIIMEHKKKEKVRVEVQGIVIDGIEYVKKSQAIMMTGTTFPTFQKKVLRFGIKSVKLPVYRHALFRKNDIEQAIADGWFNWYA